MQKIYRRQCDNTFYQVCSYSLTLQGPLLDLSYTCVVYKVYNEIKNI